MLLESEHVFETKHSHSPGVFNQILSLHKTVELPASKGLTRMVQPFRLKIPNRPLPASFHYREFGYYASTGYQLRAYLEEEGGTRIAEAHKTPLVVR